MNMHEPFTPMNYKNQQLMDNLNEFVIDIKTHLFDLKINRQKPTIEEIDLMQQRINEVLKQHAETFIKY
jgi:hypothetical protein